MAIYVPARGFGVQPFDDKPVVRRKRSPKCKNWLVAHRYAGLLLRCGSRYIVLLSYIINKKNCLDMWSFELFVAWGKPQWSIKLEKGSGDLAEMDSSMFRGRRIWSGHHIYYVDGEVWRLKIWRITKTNRVQSAASSILLSSHHSFARHPVCSNSRESGPWRWWTYAHSPPTTSPTALAPSSCYKLRSYYILVTIPYYFCLVSVSLFWRGLEKESFVRSLLACGCTCAHGKKMFYFFSLHAKLWRVVPVLWLQANPARKWGWFVMSAA
jgi:hypothetical protein